MPPDPSPGYYNLGFINFFKGNKRTEEATSKLSPFEIETINGDFTFYWYLNIFFCFLHSLLFSSLQIIHSTLKIIWKTDGWPGLFIGNIY